MSPLLLRLAAKYGPKFVKMFASQAPKVKIPAPNPTKDIGKWIESIRGAGPVSPKFRKETALLLKKFPRLFNSTSKDVNLASAQKLAQALRKYKGPDKALLANLKRKQLLAKGETDLRRLRISPQWGSKRGRGPNY